MKTFAKIFAALVVILLVLLGAGYFYFDKKFTPEKNYLILKNKSGKVPIIWPDSAKTSMLLPVTFHGDPEIYYMQFDTGSPSTIFYKKSISKIRAISSNGNLGKGKFKVGTCEVFSDRFKIIDFGEDLKENQINIIGTIGTDMLENRKTLINFKENYLEFNIEKSDHLFKNPQFSFILKKRKIIIPGFLNHEKKKFLYDSGTSGYELLTDQESWENLRLKNSQIKIDHGKSWNKTLKVYTSAANGTIFFGKNKIPLREVTYVEGYSQAQYYLMKFSGMNGMLGNKIFQNHVLFLDGKNMTMNLD